MKYPTLFSSYKIGNVEIMNRVVMPAMGTMTCSAQGEVNDHTIAYYQERAKGGTGLIIAEFATIDWEHGRSGTSVLRADDVSYILGWQRLADSVHPYGTKIFAQLQHPGNQTMTFMNGGGDIISSSDVRSMAMPDVKPRALTTEEVKGYVQKFINGASIMKAAGFDGVEIQAAHGYLVNQFVSPYTNKRTDEYGGSFENRMRFAAEIAQGIKATCGPDFALCFRISADEMTGYGYGLDEGIKIAQYFESVGIDALDISCATYESMVYQVESMGFEQGWRSYMAEAIKKVVNIPVITVGVVREPQVAEDILSSGKADFVAIGRGLITDPSWCRKNKNGYEDEVLKCISCLYCVSEFESGRKPSCGINTRKGREWQYKDLKQDGNGRKVIVVGGGPSGVEASRILAERGFRVILMEKGDKLGGQLQFANKPIGKGKINWLIDYGAKMLNKLGVDIRYNCKADSQLIKAENPYAVFIATGGNPIVPKIAGISKEFVFTAEDYLSGKVKFEGKQVAVIGGGMTGSETAALIASHGNTVTVVEMLPNICNGVYHINVAEVINIMNKNHVEILTCHALEEISDSKIKVKDIQTNTYKNLDVDNVVLALGVRSENTLYKDLEGEYENLFVIGDAKTPGRIADAIHGAFYLAWDLV